MVDKPVIMANFQRFRGGEDYIQSGICLHITDSHDLLAALDKALYDPSVRTQMTNARGSFIQRYFYRLDGHSAERVVDALESVERQISHAAPNHSFQAS